MPREFDRSHTHEIGFWPANRLLLQSGGRGWRNVHAALATVGSWSGSLAPTGHPCLAYCLHRPAHLRRSVGGSGRPEVQALRPRQFFIIPAHETTEWQRHGTSDMLMLYLRQDLIDTLSREHGSLAAAPVAIDLELGLIDPLLEQLALALLATLRAPEDGSSALYADGLVEAMVLHLLRLQGRAAPPPHSAATDRPALQRVIDVIRSDPGADLSVEALAREAGLTAQAFARAFAKTTGTTVHQFVLGCRLERARSLLTATDLPVVEIALRSGFSSQSHLSTAFKKLTGLTPGQFRA